MESSGKVPKDGGKQVQLSPSQESHRDVGKFEFYNGDKYEGQYLAFKQQLSIVRDGPGTYWTNQCIYTGKWNKDLIEEADEIIFSDKSTYTGTLENMTLDGPGMYKFKEGIEIHGTLKNNKFYGEVELVDPNGHYWKTINHMNEDEILFFPVQPFWQSVIKINNFVLPYNHVSDED